MRKILFLTTLAVCLATAQTAEAACAKIRTTSKKIVLSELYPAPNSGEEEFIELHNTGRRKVDIAGWKLTDASGKTYEISGDDLSRTVVKAGKRLVVPQSASGIYLNNGADNITLAQANDKVRSSTEYVDAPTGQSWSLVNGTWQWTPVTRGSKNASASAEGGESATSTGEVQTSSDVRLSELLPNPEGSDATDEWIAVEHIGSGEVNLHGWVLRDGSHEHVIEGTSIAAGQELVFGIDVTSVSLNNSGETIELVDPFGDVIDSTTYDAAESGLAWARFDDGWEWTSEPTPGSANARGSSGDGESGSGSTDALSITEFRALENDATGVIEGIVIAEAGLLGSQYFYMQDADAGIQVYSYAQDFPEMSVGSHVTVSGTKSESRSETRIKTSTASDIVVNGTADMSAREVEVLDESVEGVLVTVSGLVTARSSDEMTIDDSTRVMIRDGVSLDMSRVEDGAQVTVTGVVSQSGDEYRLLPRGDVDVVVSGENVAASTGGVGDGHIQIGQQSEESSPINDRTRNAAGAAAGLLSLGGGLTLRSERARKWIKKTLGLATPVAPPVVPQPAVDTVAGPTPPTRLTVEPPPYPLREEPVRYASPRKTA